MNQSNAYDFASVVPAVVASGLAVSLASFEQPSGNLTADGSPDGLYTPVSGHQNIQCMNAPSSMLKITAGEKITSQTIEADNSNHLWLAGYYPLIADNTQWRANVDGITHRILGAETDSQNQMTRVTIETVTV